MLTNKIRIGLSVGGEQDANGLQPRYAISLLANDAKFTFSGCFEFNNGIFQGNYKGIFYDLNLLYGITQRITVGIKDRRFAGVGPVAYLQISKIKIWSSWALFNPETAVWQPKTVLFGAMALF